MQFIILTLSSKANLSRQTGAYWILDNWLRKDHSLFKCTLQMASLSILSSGFVQPVISTLEYVQ